MRRPALWLALAAVAAPVALGCRDQHACNEGTVMLTITLAGRALGADEITIQASVDGMAVMGGPVMRPAGQSKGTIEVGLGSRYRTGGQLSLVASARLAGGVLAEARLTRGLDPGCTALALMLGEVPDAGDARDAARDGSVDGGPPDVPLDWLPPVDMPMPTDLPVDRPVDRPPDLPPDMMNPCPGACIAGTAMACGMCGMRTCLPNCTWGACMNQGMCAPNATEVCGNCNSGRRTCSATCTWGVCVGETGCRPGQTRPCEACPTMMQTCSAQCTWPACGCSNTKRVFVTRDRQTGNMGGLIGAHAMCTRVANDAGLTGQYRAWLSTATSGPANFMTRHPGPYVLPGGEMVATSWADLTDGTLLRPIDRDQLGMPANPGASCTIGDVWSNTNPNGTPASMVDCTGWFAGAGTSQGGNLRFFDMRWTAAGCTSILCVTPLQIYCVEQ